MVSSGISKLSRALRTLAIQLLSTTCSGYCLEYLHHGSGFLIEEMFHLILKEVLLDLSNTKTGEKGMLNFKLCSRNILKKTSIILSHWLSESKTGHK